MTDREEMIEALDHKSIIRERIADLIAASSHPPQAAMVVLDCWARAALPVLGHDVLRQALREAAGTIDRIEAEALEEARKR